jgi:hypothetical protein
MYVVSMPGVSGCHWDHIPASSCGAWLDCTINVAILCGGRWHSIVFGRWDLAVLLEGRSLLIRKNTSIGDWSGLTSPRSVHLAVLLSLRIGIPWQMRGHFEVGIDDVAFSRWVEGRGINMFFKSRHTLVLCYLSSGRPSVRLDPKMAESRHWRKL